ncbi:MAG: trigger factor [Coriobacteriia bacterium]
MLTVEVERLEGIKAKLTVTVSADEVDKVIADTYSDFSKKIRVPGFRRGKVPTPVIDAHVGAGQVVLEATETLVNDVYPRAIAQESLRIVGDPKVDLESPAEKGKPFVFTADVQLEPELTLSSLDDVTITLPSPEVTEERLDHAMEQMADRIASLEPVEDRAVEAHDFVELSFTGHLDDEPYEGNTVENETYEVSSGTMPPEFDEGLIGMKPGEEKRIEYKIAEGAANEEYVGKTIRFDATLHGIKKKVAPPIDDELAASFGFDKLEEMREALRNDIAARAQDVYEESKERESLRALADRLEGEVPEIMIDIEVRAMLRRLDRQLQASGSSLQEYSQRIGVMPEQMLKDMRPQAEEAVRNDLALAALFRQAELVRNPVDSAFEQFMADRMQVPEKERETWTVQNRPVLDHQLMLKAALGWLNEHLKVETKAEEPEAETPAAEEEPKAKAKASAKKPRKTAAKATEKAAIEDATEEAATEKAAAPKKTTTRKKAAPKRAAEEAPAAEEPPAEAPAAAEPATEAPAEDSEKHSEE